MKEVEFTKWWPTDPAGEEELEKQFSRTAEARAGSEAAQEATSRIVGELVPQEIIGQEKKSASEHISDAAARGFDLLDDPRIIDRVHALMPTPERLAMERVQKEEAWREEVRAQYRDEDYARASQRIQSEVEDMTPEEIAGYYNDAQAVHAELDADPDEWTVEDSSALYGFTNDHEAQYRAEQAALQAQAEGTEVVADAGVEEDE